jgi:hypothetical protein
MSRNYGALKGIEMLKRRLAIASIIAILILGVRSEGGTLTPEAVAARDGLAKITQKQQKANVRESFGELAHECFTWDDLNKFVRAKTAEQIARRLQGDADFIRIVTALRALSPTERSVVLEACRKPFRPTWAQLGRISSAGTTVAGQMAEQMIADAIVKMASELTVGGSAAGSPGGASAH